MLGRLVALLFISAFFQASQNDSDKLPADPPKSVGTVKAGDGRELPAMIRNPIAGIPMLRHSEKSAPVKKSPVEMAGKIEKAEARDLLSSLPLVFEPNRGQSSEGVGYIARGNGYSLQVAATEVVLNWNGQEGNSHQRQADIDDASDGEGTWLAGNHAQKLRIRFLGANPDSFLIGEEEKRSKTNYIVGAKPADWMTGINNYTKVRSKEIYNGIDVVFHGSNRDMEYDFLVAPQADPEKIAVQIEGADRLMLDGGGNIRLSCSGRELRQLKPRVFQYVGGIRKAVDARYELEGNGTFRICLADYDREKLLVIDPALEYAVAWGGSGGEVAKAAAVDKTGNVYVTGYTSSSNMTGLMMGIQGRGHSEKKSGEEDQNRSGGVDAIAAVLGSGSRMLFSEKPGATSGIHAYVMKFDVAGDLVYSTLIMGSGWERGLGIACDEAGNAYVTGVTTSPDFPVKDAMQPELRGDSDAFIVKLNPEGNGLIYGTFWGGTGSEQGAGIAVDSEGRVHVTGSTTSGDYPIWRALQPVPGDGMEADRAFVAKLSASGQELEYSTYWGGTGFSRGTGIAVDNSGNACITGFTGSSDMIVMNAAQPALGGILDAYAAKINPAGDAIVYSTYLGGEGEDRGYAIGLGRNGEVTLTGVTYSRELPLRGGIGSSYGGNGDAFVAFLNADGGIESSRYLGGIGLEEGHGIAVDSQGNLWLTGFTDSPDFGRPGGTAAETKSGRRAFVVMVKPGDGKQEYGVFLGAEGFESGESIGVDGAGQIYVCGYSALENIPPTGIAAAERQTGFRAFLQRILSPNLPQASARIDINPAPACTINYSETDCDITATGTVTPSGSENVKGVKLIADGSKTICTGLGTSCTGSTELLLGSQVIFTMNWFDFNDHEYAASSSKTVSARVALTVNNNGGGTVTSSPTGINCGTGCSTQNAPFDYGILVSLTALPNTGYMLDSWSGDCTGSNPSSCQFTMNVPRRVTATFKQQQQYVLTINGSGQGSVKVNGTSQTLTYTGTFNADSVVQLEAVPNAGWNFSSWSGDLSGASNPTSITMDANKNITATFSQITYALNLTKTGNGSVKANGTLHSLPWNGSFASGTVVQLEAVPDANWGFTSWTGDLSGTANPASITMSSDKSVAVNFSQASYTLNIAKSGNGSVKVNGAIRTLPWSEKFNAGTVVQLEAMPDATWSFSSWSGDLSGSANPTSIIVNADKNVTAVFSQITYALNLGKTGNGSVKVNGTLRSLPYQGSFSAGSVVQLEAVPDAAWGFASWSGDLTGSFNPTSISMDATRTVTANFSQIKYSLNLAKTGNGSVRVNGTLHSLPWTESFTSGSIVQLEAVPDATWSFSSWSGDLSGSTSPALVTMSANKNITANFSMINYTLSFTKSGNGSIKVNGTLQSLPWSGKFPSGSVVQLEAVPDATWSFSSWSGDLSDSTNPASITMGSDKSVAVNFSLASYTLNITKSGNGSVKVNGTIRALPWSEKFNAGMIAQLEAMPDATWSFSSWSGDISDSTNPVSIAMNGNRNVVASFIQANYTLNVAKIGNGSVLVNGEAKLLPYTGTFSAGAAVQLEAVPDANWSFSSWTGDLSGNVNPTSIIMNTHKSVTVNFTSATTRILAVTKLGTGTGTITSNPGGINCAGTCPSQSAGFINGTTVTLNAKEDSGSTFIGWDGGGCSSVGPCVVTLNQDINVNATFVSHKALLTSPAGNITTTTPAYVWQAVSVSTHYQLLVWDANNVPKIQAWYSAAQSGCATGTRCTVTPSTALSQGTYKWWIQTWVNNAAGPWSNAMAFSILEPPLAPVLLSPSGSISTGTPAFKWNAASTATGYQLVVWNSSNVEVFQASYTATEAGCPLGTGQCSVQPGKQMGKGTYQWWAQARNDAGKGPWSGGKTFAIIPPPQVVLLSPTGALSITLPSYSWNAVPAALSYQLLVWDASNVAKVQASYTAVQAGCGAGTGKCTATPASKLGEGSYRWWILASNDAGDAPWSNAMAFTISPPGKAVLASPSGIVSRNTPTYTWNAVSSASYYQLLVWDSANAAKVQNWYTASQAGCDGGVGQCSVTPAIQLVKGSYRWWVLTWNEVGNGPWSNAMTITISPPQKAVLISPSGTIAKGAPTYKWYAVDGSTYYQLLVYDAKNATKVQTWYTTDQAGCGTGAGQCAITPSVSLSLGSYRWWVQSWNPIGDGPWSDEMAFVMSPPPPPAVLLSPKDTVSSSRPAYKWNAVPSATRYKLLVLDAAPATKVQESYEDTDAGCGSGTGQCMVIPATDLPQGSYQWRVLTSNDAGDGTWSNSLSFTVVTADKKAVLVSPWGTTGVSQPTYKWKAVASSTYYRLLVRGAGNEDKVKNWYKREQAGCGTGVGECSVVPATVLSPGSYKWWIQTYDDTSGEGPWSDEMAFTVVLLPSKPVLISPSGDIKERIPTYKWNAVSNVTAYQLSVKDSSAASVIEKSYTPAEAGCANGQEDCSVMPSVSLSFGSYRWQVRASNSNGTGDWSDPMDFVLSNDKLGPYNILMVPIPAGNFMMGSNKGESDEKPVSRVTLSRAFEVGKYEITQAQWKAVMGSNSSRFQGNDNLPVENVSWNDVQDFLAKLNALNDGYIYRLPTEAEWEFTCRAGTTGDYAGNLDDMAWYVGNSGGKTHPVGTKNPNAWGLYDMHGNVREWVQDWYDANYYSVMPLTDPPGPAIGSVRADRGGSWYVTATRVRSSARGSSAPDTRDNALGFRLVRTAQ